MIAGAHLTVVYRDRLDMNDLILHQLIDAESNVPLILEGFFSYAKNVHQVTLQNLVKITVVPIRD